MKYIALLALGHFVCCCCLDVSIQSEGCSCVRGFPGYSGGPRLYHLNFSRLHPSGLRHQQSNLKSVLLDAFALGRFVLLDAPALDERLNFNHASKYRWWSDFYSFEASTFELRFKPNGTKVCGGTLQSCVRELREGNDQKLPRKLEEDTVSLTETVDYAGRNRVEMLRFNKGFGNLLKRIPRIASHTKHYHLALELKISERVQGYTNPVINHLRYGYRDTAVVHVRRGNKLLLDTPPYIPIPPEHPMYQVRVRALRCLVDQFRRATEPSHIAHTLDVGGVSKKAAIYIMTDEMNMSHFQPLSALGYTRWNTYRDFRPLQDLVSGCGGIKRYQSSISEWHAKVKEYTGPLVYNEFGPRCENWLLFVIEEAILASVPIKRRIETMETGKGVHLLTEVKRDFPCDAVPRAAFSRPQVVSSTRKLGGATVATTGEPFLAKKSRTYQGLRWRSTQTPDLLDSKTTDTSPGALLRRFSCSRAAVTTTINHVSLAILKAANLTGWCLIIVGDATTPDAEYHELANSRNEICFLSLDDQMGLPYATVNITPRNHFARKNIGYLYAVHHGARIIFDFDDDNELDVASFLGHGASQENGTTARRGTHLARLAPQQRPNNVVDNVFLDPYSEFFGAPQMWPRGFPLSHINNNKRRTMIKRSQRSLNLGAVQSLANHDPDVDAVYRLGPRSAFPLPFTFPTSTSKVKESMLVLDKHIWAPFNAQATLFYQTAFYAMALPLSVHGRVADIWRSYIAQACFWQHDYRLAFSEPLVTQQRNVHDYMRDFNAELPLFMQTTEVVRLLSQLREHDLRGSGATAADAIQAAYITLYEHGILQVQDVVYIVTWLADLQAVGIHFPEFAS